MVIKKRFIVLILFFSCTGFSSPLTFSPEGFDFSFVLGPQGNVLTKSRDCNSPNVLKESFKKWKIQLGELITGESICQCGKKELEKETYEYFKNMLFQEKEVRSWQFFKKYYLNKDLENICYTNLTNILPKKINAIAKRQLIKDLDKYNFENSIFDNSGINCFATAMEASGYLNTPRFVSQYEFDAFLNGPMCNKVGADELRQGDIISYHRAPKRYEDPNELNGWPIHASIMITDNLVFEKKGGHKDFPYQLASFKEALTVTKGPIAGYRCKTNIDLLNESKEISDYHEMLSHIIEIESCLNNIYTTNFHDPSLNNVYSFVRINLEIVSEVISQKRRLLIDPETFKPFEGKELEYEYWMLLHARISSMYDNTNQNLEFPNLHDYLGEISR